MDPSILKGRFIEYEDIKLGDNKECKELIHDMDMLIDIMLTDPIKVANIKSKLIKEHPYYCSNIVNDFMNYNPDNYVWITDIKTAQFYNMIYSDKLDMNVVLINLGEDYKVKYDTSLCSFENSFFLIFKNHISFIKKVRFIADVYQIEDKFINGYPGLITHEQADAATMRKFRRDLRQQRKALYSDDEDNGDEDNEDEEEVIPDNKNKEEVPKITFYNYIYRSLMLVIDKNTIDLSKYQTENRFDLPINYLKGKMVLTKDVTTVKETKDPGIFEQFLKAVHVIPEKSVLINDAKGDVEGDDEDQQSNESYSNFKEMLHKNFEDYAKLVEPYDNSSLYMCRSGMSDALIEISKNRVKYSKYKKDIGRIISCSPYDTYLYVHMFRYMPISFKVIWTCWDTDISNVNVNMILNKDVQQIYTYMNISSSVEGCKNPENADLEYLKIYAICIEPTAGNAMKRIAEKRPEIFTKEMFDYLEANYAFDALEILESAGIAKPN